MQPSFHANVMWLCTLCTPITVVVVAADTGWMLFVRDKLKSGLSVFWLLGKLGVIVSREKLAILVHQNYPHCSLYCFLLFTPSVHRMKSTFILINGFITSTFYPRLFILAQNKINIYLNLFSIYFNKGFNNVNTSSLHRIKSTFICTKGFITSTFDPRWFMVAHNRMNVSRFTFYILRQGCDLWSTKLVLPSNNNNQKGAL